MLLFVVVIVGDVKTVGGEIGVVVVVGCCWSLLLMLM